MPEQGSFLTCPFLFFFFFLALTLDTLYCLFPQYSFTYPPTKHSFRGYLLSDCITQATGSKVPGVNVFIYSCVLAWARTAHVFVSLCQSLACLYSLPFLALWARALPSRTFLGFLCQRIGGTAVRQEGRPLEEVGGQAGAGRDFHFVNVSVCENSWWTDRKGSKGIFKESD